MNVPIFTIQKSSSGQYLLTNPAESTLQLDVSKSFGYALNDRFYTAKQRSTSGIENLCIHPGTLLSVALESIF